VSLPLSPGPASFCSQYPPRTLSNFWWLLSRRKAQLIFPVVLCFERGESPGAVSPFFGDDWDDLGRRAEQ